ncbi:hypothetical protein [Lancefieldella rimae]
MKDVFKMPNLSRRSLLRGSLGITRSAIALTALSFGNTILGGCMFAREIPDKETALSAILEELEKRYGEKFHQTYETQVVEKAYPKKGEKKYDFLLNPSTDESKIFTARVYVREDIARQSGNILDNYQQHIFDPIVCTPFREYLQSSPHVDGYSVRLSWNKMDSKVWKKEQVEEYMGKGIDGDPEIHMTIVIPRDTKDNLAKVIYAFHKDLSEFKRNMQLRIGMTGTDPRTVNELYLTPLDFQILSYRTELSYEDILRSVDLHFKRNESSTWDGTGEIGDPDHTQVSLTFKR